MVYRIADNVLSPLGATTAANCQAVLAGQSALRRYDSYSGRPEDDYVASRFSDSQRQQLMVSGLMWFESLVYRSVQQALQDCSIDVAGARTLLVVSTTKANIEHLPSLNSKLSSLNSNYDTLLPAASAQRIAALLGMTTRPLVVSSACISGVAAMITAQRLLEADVYDTAIVVGCDVVSHFVVSGFQSLKALSPEPCRPFDIERMGLNLGEAAATVILTTHRPAGDAWALVRGAIRNDAYHISSPSPKGEGCASALRYVTEGVDIHTIAALNVHGTATMYNDQMESKAIEAAGLSDVPINTLKGYFGHTLGASGILETILTMHAVGQGVLPATRGYSERGVSGRVSISSAPVSISGQSLVKMISGFGGCNAAVYLAMSDERLVFSDERLALSEEQLEVVHSVRITPQGITVDSQPLPTQSQGDSMLTEVYKRYIGSYPRYYKMDRLSQLGFVASELLIPHHSSLNSKLSSLNTHYHTAVVLFNRTSSTWTDRQYLQSITTGDDYYPSPSLFVYTLPNMVCGEIALRHGYHTETSFYILDNKDDKIMNNLVLSTFMDHTLNSIVAGWLDYEDDRHFEAEFKLIVKK